MDGHRDLRKAKEKLLRFPESRHQGKAGRKSIAVIDQTVNGYLVPLHQAASQPSSRNKQTTTTGGNLLHCWLAMTAPDSDILRDVGFSFLPVAPPVFRAVGRRWCWPFRVPFRSGDAPIGVICCQDVTATISTASHHIAVECEFTSFAMTPLLSIVVRKIAALCHSLRDHKCCDRVHADGLILRRYRPQCSKTLSKT